MPEHQESRCTVVQRPPLNWLNYSDDEHVSTRAVHAKILALSDIDQELLIGQVQALREMAARGEIEVGDEGRLKAIRLDPALFELRWDVAGLLLRQYHAEPLSLPADLVTLHFHEKIIVEGNQDAIDELQDLEVEAVWLRYMAGAPSEWGSRH